MYTSSALRVRQCIIIALERVAGQHRTLVLLFLLLLLLLQKLVFPREHVILDALDVIEPRVEIVREHLALSPDLEIVARHHSVEPEQHLEVLVLDLEQRHRKSAVGAQRRGKCDGLQLAHRVLHLAADRADLGEHRERAADRALIAGAVVLVGEEGRGLGRAGGGAAGKVAAVRALDDCRGERLHAKSIIT